MSALPYLITKVTVPPVRMDVITRLPLISRLDTRVPLLLLAAGAGFGKTTLISAWASQTGSHVAWVSLDEQDQDPTRFWIYVLLALRTCLGLSFAEATFGLLTSSPPSSLPTVLTSLLNDLARQQEEVALVLDDYHLIEEPAIHHSLRFWLAHAPACLHLVLSTRTDPDLPLSRLRACGQVVEIRDADLQLNVHESGRFLTQTMGLHLGEEAILQLWQRTEGWITGLQLAALSLRPHADPGAFVQRFSGTHRFIVDYVQDEILGSIPLATQRFLLQTSILPSLHADLCEALTGEPASQQMLEELERANLFVIPLDTERRWYRLHPLIRSSLQARVQAVEPELIPRLHFRAMTWYAEQHLLPEAIPHALAAHDFACAADLIERFLIPQSWRNAYHSLRRWLNHLPHEVLCSHPNLAFLAAQALLLTTPSGPSAWQLVQAYLEHAEHGYREAGNREALGAVLTGQAVISSFQGAFLRAFAQARQALGLLPPEDRQWRGQALCVLGTEAILAGQYAQAVPLLQQALALCDATGSLPGSQFATLMLGEVSLATGDLQQASTFFRRVLSIASRQPDLTRDLLTDDAGGRRSHFERLAWYGLAHLAYLRNDLAEAQDALQESLREGQIVLIHILTPGLLLQVRLLYAQGEIEQARLLLLEMNTSASRPDVRREIGLCQAWLALKHADLSKAQRWAEELTGADVPLTFARREEETLLLARLRLQEGQPEVALDLLASLLQEARACACLHSELQILMLSASAEAARGAQEQACTTLLQVVTTPRHLDYHALFLEEGTPMETLLTRLLTDGREHARASSLRHLLQVFESTPIDTEVNQKHPACLLEPLTPQEQRVLSFLAGGASNQEIANELVVSLRTVKKHVSSILKKLGASNRTQAIAHARARGLL